MNDVPQLSLRAVLLSIALTVVLAAATLTPKAARASGTTGM